MKVTNAQLNPITRPYYESAATVVRREIGKELELAALDHGLRLFFPPGIPGAVPSEYPADVLTDFPDGFVGQDARHEVPYRRQENCGVHIPAAVDGREFTDPVSGTTYRVCFALNLGSY